MRNKGMFMIVGAIVVLLLAGIIFGISVFQKKGFEECVENEGMVLNGNQCVLESKVYLNNSEDIIDLGDCESYFDGCNTCFVKDGEIGGCTRMYCPEEMLEEPKCLREKQQLANPASENCIEKGGKLEIKEEDAGQYGICRFEDGSFCEEWAFMREECSVGENFDKPLVRVCTMEYAPVCGVDNITYGNDCMAGDVEVAYQGECK